MFSINYKVTISDINYGGHMGNERALILFQQVRIDFYNSLGLSELNIGNGIGTIQKNSYVNYHKEIFLGQTLTVKIVSIEAFRTSFNIKYEVYNEENLLCIDGSTLIISYDYFHKKVCKLPSEFLVAIKL